MPQLSALVGVPESLRPLLIGYHVLQVTTGRSSTSVFRLQQDGNTKWFLKRGEGSELEEEEARLRWLSGRVSVPSVVAFARNKAEGFLLTEALQGCDGAAAQRTNPEMVVREIARALASWHLQPNEGCPFDQSLARQIEKAKRNAEMGQVDQGDLDEERRGCSVTELLQQIARNRPASEELVLTHGDPCLPNAIFDERGHFMGFVDCGRAGLADRYQDLALAARSIADNIGVQWVRPFFERYGRTAIDEKKLAFYRLLDEFF